MLSEKPWKPFPVLIALAVMGFFFFVFSGIEAAVLHHYKQKKVDENSIGQLLLVVMMIHGSILLGIGVVIWRFKLRWRDAFGFSAPGKVSAIVLGLFAAATFLPIGLLLHTGSMWLIEAWNAHGTWKIPVETQLAVTTLQNAQSTASRVILILFAVVIAPAAEEMLFRGILYPSIKQSGFKYTAIWGTSLLFAAFHLSLPVLAPLFVLALILTWLYERTDNLLAPIVAHAAFNAINVVFLYYGEAIAQFLTRVLFHQ